MSNDSLYSNIQRCQMIPYKRILIGCWIIPNKGILKYKYLSENAEKGMDRMSQSFTSNKVAVRGINEKVIFDTKI